MQITIVLDGSEGQSQLRRISNAVLALAGAALMPDVGSITHVSVSAPVRMMEAADLPDTGADAPATPPAAPVSAAPLPPPAPPAPSLAAADMFASAPAAPTAGVPAAPSVSVPPAPPAPSAAAPSAPAAPTSHAPGVDLDKAGLPWDARIHSGSKEKNKDDTWRQRRNLPDGERERVEAELRALMALPATITVGDTSASAAPLPPSPPVPPAPNAAGSASSSNTTGEVPANASAATAPAVPPGTDGDMGNVPPAPPAPPTSAPATAATPTPPVPPAPTAAAPNAPATGANPFATLMTKVSSNVTAGKLTETQVHAALHDVGLRPDGEGIYRIGQLAARPDLAAIVSDKIDAYLAGGA